MTITTENISESVVLSDTFVKTKISVTVLSVNDTINIIDTLVRKRSDYVLYEKLLAYERYFNLIEQPTSIVSALELFALDSIRIGTITDWQFSPDYKTLYNDGGGYATTTWHNNIQSYGKITKTSKHWAGEYTVGNWEVELNDPQSDTGDYTIVDGTALWGTAIWGTNLWGTGRLYSYQSIWGSLYGVGSEARGKSILLRAMIQDRPLTYVSQFEGQIQDVTAENGKVILLIQDKLGGLDDKQFVWDYANIGSSNGAHVWGRVKKIYGTQVMWDDYGDVEYIERKSPETTFWDTAVGGLFGGIIGLVSGVGGGILGFLSGALGNLPKSSQVTNAYYKYSDYNAIPDDTVASGQKVKFFAGSICAIATNSNSPLKDIQEKVINGGGFTQEGGEGIYGTFEFADTNGIKVDDWVYVRQPLVFGGSPNQVIKQILCGSNINTPYNAETTYDEYGNLIHESSFSSLWNSEIENLDLLTLNRIIGVNDEVSPLDLLKEVFSETKINFYIDENNKFACRTIRPRGYGMSSVATYTEDTNILNFQYKRSTDAVQNGFIMYYDRVAQNGAYNGEYNKKLVLNFKNPITNISKFGTIESKWIHDDDDAKAIAFRVIADTELGVDRGILDTTLYGVIQNTADAIRVTHSTGSVTNKLFEIESYSKDFTNSKVQFNLIDAERIYGYGNCAWATAFNETSGTSLSGYGYMGLLPRLSYATLGSLLSGDISAFATTANFSRGYANFAGGYEDYFGWYAFFGSTLNQYSEIILLQPNHKQTIYDNLTMTRGLFNTIQRQRIVGDHIYLIAPASYDVINNLTPNALLNKFNLGSTVNINNSFGTGFKFF